MKRVTSYGRNIAMGAAALVWGTASAVAAGQSNALMAPDTVEGMTADGYIQAITQNSDFDIPLQKVDDNLLQGSLGDEVPFFVVVENCEDAAKGCSTLVFVAWSEVPDVDLARGFADAFNQNAFFGRSFVDGDGDIRLEYGVDFTGGVTPEHIGLTHDLWAMVLAEFVIAFIEANGMGSATLVENTGGTPSLANASFSLSDVPGAAKLAAIRARAGNLGQVKARTGSHTAFPPLADAVRDAPNE